jgi:hypothetical protein
VGADAVFFAVVDRAQINDLLEGAPAAFDLEELLVAQGDVLRGQGRVGGAEQVLAVEVGLAGDRGLVDAQQAAGGAAQVALQIGLGGDDAGQLVALGAREGVGAVDQIG